MVDFMVQKNIRPIWGILQYLGNRRNRVVILPNKQNTRI